MSEEFQMYEEEFQKFSKLLLIKFHTAPSATDQDYREAIEDFSNLKRSLDGMQLSQVGSNSNFTKLTQYKSEFQNLKAQYQQYIQHTSPTLQMAIKQNEQLIEYTKIAYEAEGHATKTQFELKNQTNKLDRILGNASATTNEIRDSESIINRIQFRTYYRKILSYSMVGLIIIALIIIIWYKIF